MSGLKQCDDEAGPHRDEDESNTDSVEENIAVDEDAEVSERKLYQGMEEFLTVDNRDFTQDTNRTSGAPTSSSNRPHKGQLQIFQRDGNLFALTEKEARRCVFSHIRGIFFPFLLHQNLYKCNYFNCGFKFMHLVPVNELSV